MHGTKRARSRTLQLGMLVLLVAGMSAVSAAGGTQAGLAATAKAKPKFSHAVAFDTSKPLRDLAQTATWPTRGQLPPELGLVVPDTSYHGDGALQGSPIGASAVLGGDATPAVATIPSPVVNFEGLRNTDNPNGILVNPPDPVGDVGPNNYVEMVNLVFAVYDKQGNRLVGPTPLGALWQNFAVPDCAGLSGDPIVLYDQTEDRWILSQFTSAGPEYWNCVAVSKTGDPTGAYYRYAFSAG